VFLQHTQDVKVVFDEESLIKILKKHIENEYYEVRYSGYQLISTDIEITEDRKPLIKFRFQKVVQTLEPKKVDDDADI